MEHINIMNPSSTINNDRLNLKDWPWQCAEPPEAAAFRTEPRRCQAVHLMRSTSNARTAIPSRSRSFKRKCIITNARESL